MAPIATTTVGEYELKLTQLGESLYHVEAGFAGETIETGSHESLDEALEVYLKLVERIVRKNQR